MLSIEKIEDLLTSNKLSVLTQCDKFLDQKLDKERLRGEAAERRANITIAIAGAVSVFLVFIAGIFLAKSQSANKLVTIIYAASVLWFARAIYYSLKSIQTQSRYQVMAESIFEFQNETEINALKKIIASKLWEYQQSIQPNTERLFYVQRAQRALIVLIFFLLSLGLVMMMLSHLMVSCEICLIILFSFIVIFLWFFGDKIIENSGIWNHDEQVKE